MGHLKPSRSDAGVAFAAAALLVFAFAAPRAQQPSPSPQPATQQEPQQGQRGQRGQGRGAAEQPAAAPAPAPAPAPGTPTKPYVPLAASTLAAHPDQYYGEFVTVTATVDQSLSTLAFSVDQDKTKSTGNDILVLAPRMNAPVDQNAYVTAIGELMKFDPDEVAKKSKDIKVDLPADVIARYRGKPVILATAVINASGVNLAQRLAPPLNAEEQAFQKVMLQVGPANAALRAALDKMDTAAAKENAAVLQQAFAKTEAFWKARAKTDAVQWAQDAHKHTDTVNQAIATGKWDEAKTAAGTLAQQCAACHGVYRERFDDGSFRIKTGSR
jgi:hypothetical protein